MATVLKTGVRTMDESFAKLLDRDTNSDHVTPAMHTDSPIEPGPALVQTARFTSREFHELEKQHLWSRVWQMAAHEDDFPNVGDVVPYDIVDKSYLVVRVAEDEYKAYYNACLHRGRKLRESRAKGLDELRCAFHGWSWGLDGYELSGDPSRSKTLNHDQFGILTNLKKTKDVERALSRSLAVWKM